MHPKTSFIARVLLAAILMIPAGTLVAGQTPAEQPSATPQETQEAVEKKPCRWWQFGRCDETQAKIEGLPAEAPRTGTVITVDVSTNTAYLFKDGEVVEKTLVATGSDKLLKRGKRFWLFRTPRGRHKVLRKIEDPVWRKPDWAFIEEGKKIPAPDSPTRLVKGKLGKYALDLGDGILIHGTKEVNSFGKKASHGCIRMPADALERVYKEAKVGTEVWVFESQPVQTAGNEKGRSDLEMAAAGGEN